MATDNTAYYAAERALRTIIDQMDPETIRDRLCRASEREGCEFNRILFHYFDICESDHGS
jgi:predicted component of type VI protein secretion system